VTSGFLTMSTWKDGKSRSYQKNNQETSGRRVKGVLMHAWASVSSPSINGVARRCRLWAGQVIRYSTALFKLQLVCLWCCTTRNWHYGLSCLRVSRNHYWVCCANYWNQNKIFPWAGDQWSPELGLANSNPICIIRRIRHTRSIETCQIAAVNVSSNHLAFFFAAWTLDNDTYTLSKAARVVSK